MCLRQPLTCFSCGICWICIHALCCRIFGLLGANRDHDAARCITQPAVLIAKRGRLCRMPWPPWEPCSLETPCSNHRSRCLTHCVELHASAGVRTQLHRRHQASKSKSSDAAHFQPYAPIRVVGMRLDIFSRKLGAIKKGPEVLKKFSFPTAFC